MSGDKIIAEARERKLLKTAETLVGRYGEALLTLQDHIEDPRESHDYITEVRLRVRYGSEGDILVILKAEGARGKTIAFHSGDTVPECVQQVANRLKNGSLKWKEDIPYEQR